jgi:selenide, water dikinase
LIVGSNTVDDAAVYKLNEDLAIVQSVDYFTPVVDDPYAYGAIAMANGLSDIYAMGAKPLTALNIVGFPVGTLPLSMLTTILKGGADKAAEAGVSVAGGHTITDPEPKYGVAVTGIVHPNKVITNASAQPGDSLVLTKPLGIGILTTALKRDLLAPDLIHRITAIMCKLNKAAAEAMIETGVNAATDVTGFGLLGHLSEVTKASGVGARVKAKVVPVIEEARGFANEGIVPGGTRNNLSYISGTVEWDHSLDDAIKLILCDAQTSGGLLISVAKDKLPMLLDQLQCRQVPGVVIGEIIEDQDSRIYVEP